MKKTLYNYLVQNGFLIVNKKLIETIGLDKAAVLSELIDKYIYFKDNNVLFEGSWFYYTYEKFDKIGLKRRRIDPIINFLQKIGFIETKNAGMPKRRYFKLNEEKIISFIKEKSNQGNDEADVSQNTQYTMEKIGEIFEKQEDHFDKINGLSLSILDKSVCQLDKSVCQGRQTLINNRIIKPDKEKQNMCVHTHEKNFLTNYFLKSRKLFQEIPKTISGNPENYFRKSRNIN